MPFTPKPDELVAILPHIRYEIEQCFCVPKFDEKDEHIKESIFLAILIHARLLVDFFETKSEKRQKDDVLCSDFGPSAIQISMNEEDRKRLNKDIAHLTYSRLRHTPETKPWPVSSILNSLHAVIIDFVEFIIKKPPDGLDKDELSKWKSLFENLKKNKLLIPPPGNVHMSAVTNTVTTGYTSYPVSEKTKKT